MRSISDAILRFFELVEAEGRTLRKTSIASVENMLVIFFGLALMFFGALVACVSLYLWLSTLIGAAAAAAAVAVLLLILGTALLMKGHNGALAGKSILGEPAAEKSDTSLENPKDGSAFFEQAE